MEISGNPECKELLINSLRVFKPFRGTYINIDYGFLPKGIAGRVNAEIETIRKRKIPRFFGKEIVRIRRRIKNNEFYIRINANLAKIEEENLRKQVVTSVIIHELLHIERKDLLEHSKNYRKRKHKKIHSSLEKEALKRLNALREMGGLKPVGKENYIEKEILSRVSNAQ
ncbi:MAG: hypothetical protein ACP5MV_03980 [Candidatus Parvarchaeum sp.]